MSNRISNFIERYSNLLSIALSIVGVGSTLCFGFYANEESLTYKTIIAVVSICMIIVCTSNILAMIFALKAKSLANDEIEKAQCNVKEIKEKLSEMEHNDRTHSELLHEYLISIRNFTKRTNQFLRILYDDNDRTLQNLKLICNAYSPEQLGVVNEEAALRELKTCRKSYISSVHNKYNSYTKNILNDIREKIEKHLAQKGIETKICVCIKFLDDIYDIQKNINEYRVYAAFRDSRTYDTHLREVGKWSYDVIKNGDFNVCIRGEHYIRNALHIDSNGYTNQKEHYINDYNCVATVPILFGGKNDNSLFGFLCCDTLYLEDDANNIFDEDITAYMQSAAFLMGLYLDAVNDCWDVIVNNYKGENFIQYLYQYHAPIYINEENQ